MGRRVSCLFLSMLTAWMLLFGAVAVSADYGKTAATKIYNETTLEALQSKSCMLLDYQTGTVLFHKNETERYPVGNMVKIMTLLLTFESIAKGETTLETEFAVSKHAQQVSVGRARVFLDGNKREKITVKQAVQAICIASANDAACALAEYLGGSETSFVERMNAKAEELGLKDTKFVDSTGIDAASQYTSAHDMAILSRSLVLSYPEVLEYTAQTYGVFQHTSTGAEDTTMISSNNLTRGQFYPDSDGLLVGFSNSDGYAQAATVEGGGRRVIAVVIGAANENIRAAELKKLMEYGLTKFEQVMVDAAGTFVRRVTVSNGKDKKISVSTAADFSVLLRAEDKENVVREVVVDGELKAPINKGDVVGEVIYKLGEEELGRVEVVADRDMEKANWFILLIRKILSWLGLD